MGEKEMAKAVILQAIKDASALRDTYNRRTARNFLTGCTSEWRDSLETWSDLAGCDSFAIMRKYRAKWSRNV
jgi:hypothetical protein